MHIIGIFLMNKQLDSLVRPQLGILIGETQAATSNNNNFLEGGKGNDIIVGDSGQDDVLGGGGSDFIVTGGGDDNIFGDHAFPQNYIDSSGYSNYHDFSPVYRENANDYIIFYHIHDWTLAADGEGDIIYSGAGNDYVMGLYGNDSIYGGSGNDILLGDGDDRLYGGGNDDTLLGGTGNDSLYGDDEDTPLEFQGICVVPQNDNFDFQNTETLY
jgi:Ca2+-binding RTX toxin-like protein